MKLHTYLTIALFSLVSALGVQADDTDLFTTPPTAAQRPNVLIVVDNTANWNTAFDAEMSALASVVGGLTDQVNVGIMMFTETGAGNSNPDGAYVRSAIKQMTATNKAALVDLIQSFSKINDKGNAAKFSLASLESYLYLTGKDAYAGHNKAKRDTTAFQANGTTYISPMSDACQANFVIFISNGPASDNTSDGTASKNKLATYSGATPVEITLSPNGESSNWSDEWARWLAGNDQSSSLAGVQNILTYTVDIYSSVTGQSDDHTALLKSMSGGNDRYYYVAAADATSTSVIASKLNEVFKKIQAVDSVFAASSLPVSVSVRGTLLNQVYMGVFRPDQNASPRWPGNMKQYKLASDSSGRTFLADINGAAIENSITGYVSPTVTSFWSSDSEITPNTVPPSYYWTFRYPSGDDGNDAPDGDKVEKGGAAQKVRSAYATSQTARKVFTCTGTCGNGTTLSTSTTNTVFGTSNSANITTALLGAADATERDNIINWVRGADNMNDEDGDGVTTEIRPSVHGDVLHSRPAVINYNRTGTTEGNDIYVYYGGNDGHFRGIKGGQAASDGAEQWSFIPSEFFGKLKRLRDAETVSTAAITTLKPKSYFADGPVSVYLHDNNSDDRYDIGVDAADKVQLFLGMRRGGRFIYALDVSSPTAPKFLWKKSSSDYSELGYTWSEPRVAKINWGGSAKQVLIFGGGYDSGANYANGTSEPDVDDLDPDRTYTDIATPTVSGSQTTTVTTTTRRQISADNSASGTISWNKTVTVTTSVIDTAPNPATTTTTVTGPTTTGMTANRTMGRIIYVVDIADGSVLWSGGRSGSGATLTVAGMDYSIPSDISIIDIDGNGYIDTLYVGDTGGNVWRGNISDTNSANWTVAKLASLGGSDVNKRKFLYKPDVLVDGNTRSIMMGSGDREHPLDTIAVNRFYMLRDTGSTIGLTETNLYDATSNDVQSSNAATASTAEAALAAANGWYITFETGEKVVGNSLTLSGTTFFATNKPTAVTAGQCSNLGLARYYAVNYENGAALADYNSDGVINASDRVTATAVGIPPSPTLVQNPENGRPGVCMGAHCEQGTSDPVGQRFRVYWYLDLDK